MSKATLRMRVRAAQAREERVAKVKAVATTVRDAVVNTAKATPAATKRVACATPGAVKAAAVAAKDAVSTSDGRQSMWAGLKKAAHWAVTNPRVNN